MDINIFWILVVVLFIWLLKQNKNRVLKKAVGAFLILFGVFILNPLPSLDDVLFAPLFFSVMGWEFSIQGFKTYILPYTFYTMGIGISIALVGMYISNFKLKYLTSKIKGMFKRK